MIALGVLGGVLVDKQSDAGVGNLALPKPAAVFLQPAGFAGDRDGRRTIGVVEHEIAATVIPPTRTVKNTLGLEQNVYISNRSETGRRRRNGNEPDLFDVVQVVEFVPTGAVKSLT